MGLFNKINIFQKRAKFFKTKYFILLIEIFILKNEFSYGQENFKLRETIKNYENSELIFYNLIEDATGTFIGSSNGIFFINNQFELKKYSEDNGYIIKNENKQIVVSNIIPEGKTYTYSYLLQGENLEKKSYYAILKNNILLIIVEGKLRIYEQNLFSEKLGGISIRSISNNYIATYNGIYEKNNLVNPKIKIYSDSYIREYEENLYICYNGLAIYNNDSTIILNNEKEELVLNNKNLGYAKDIVKINNEKKFILFTTKGVYKTDLKKEINLIIGSIDTTEITNKLDFPKLIDYNISQGYNDRIIFYINKTLYSYYINKNETDVYLKLEEGIFQGKKFNNEIFYLTNSGLFKHNLSSGIKKIASNKSSFHTFEIINNFKYLLSSDVSLEIFNSITGDFNVLKVDEFNFGAMRLNNDSLYIGGVNGLNLININDLNNLKFNPNGNFTNNNSNLLKFLILFLFIFLITSSFINYKFYKKEKNGLNSIRIESSLKTKIENFINQNITTVTIELIMKEFNLSYRKLDSLFKPISVAKIIKESRLIIVERELKKGSSLKDISTLSGYSISYLKKIKIN